MTSNADQTLFRLWKS